MRKIIIMIMAAMTMTATAWAQSPCSELQRATDEARARAHARALERQEQTILQPVPSISDTSCLDSWNAGVDASRYDPAAVVSVLRRQAEQRA